MDALVSEFLAEEKKMLAWMDGEKRKSKINPEKHRSYASEWNYFYENKCKKEGVKVHPSMVRWEFLTCVNFSPLFICTFFNTVSTCGAAF